MKNACRNIYAARKNSTQADRVHTNVWIYVEKNVDPEISVRTHFDDNGSPKTTPDLKTNGQY